MLDIFDTFLDGADDLTPAAASVLGARQETGQSPWLTINNSLLLEMPEK
jgi:hypothetical protein